MERDGATSVKLGLDYLTRLQTDQGSLHGDYDGPLFLLPGYIFAHYTTRTPLAEETRQAFIRTIRKEQNADGGYGLHREGKSYLFSTVLNHVALRLLGVARTDPTVQRTHQWIQANGGAIGIPSWGKYWLAILRLYEWVGINPVQPEALLLPRWFPLHPGKLWCHARMVYLPVSYLYGRRWQVADAPLLAELREELYGRPYNQIRFDKARNNILANDLYLPHSFCLRRVHDVLTFLERWIPGRLREKALAYTLDQIKQEQHATSFIDIGPVSKAFDVVACFAAEPGSEHTRKAIAQLPVYIYDCESGLTMQSYNSSELWDTAFAVQALAATGQVENYLPFARQAHRFIADNQILEDLPQYHQYYRDRSLGGWPFSNRAHGWPIVDCTSEGLKAALLLEAYVPQPIPRERLFQAVDRLLDWQNTDGGWPTYERNRGNRFLEWLNPSEMFGNIMCDFSFVELTSSAMQGLTATRARFGDELAGRLGAVDNALRRGAQFLRRQQRPDGSWEGAWGVCFTYGTWFGVTGLVGQTDPGNEPVLRRAAEFLLSKQLPDGGWGESYMSSVTSEYVHHPEGGQVVMTAWALLALLQIPADSTRTAIERGLQFLVQRQRDNGDWPQASVTGVFNKNCMLHYRFYRNYFPIWALGLAKTQGFSI